jgi:5-formyltetrahydrofolate cyclo-ligase
MRGLLDASPPESIPLPAEARFAHFLSLARTVFGYRAVRGEVSVDLILAAARAGGKAIALPRVEGDRLSFRRVDDPAEALPRGSFGIPEPAADAPTLYPGELSALLPLIVLVPGLAFDRSGGRLGQGAGYYDRFLADLLADLLARATPTAAGSQVAGGISSADILLVGACRVSQLVDQVPTEAHDIRLDCVLAGEMCIFKG